MTHDSNDAAQVDCGAGLLRSEIHEPDNSRRCLHLLGEPPTSFLLSREAVGRLNFQPRVCPAPSPCIASRIGDVLTIEFDAAGPANNRSHRQKVTPLKYRYQLRAGADWPSVVVAVKCPDLPVESGSTQSEQVSA